MLLIHCCFISKFSCATHTVNRPDKVVAVSVPEDASTTEDAAVPEPAEARESIRVQSLIVFLAMPRPTVTKGVILPILSKSRYPFAIKATDRTAPSTSACGPAVSGTVKLHGPEKSVFPNMFSDSSPRQPLP